MVKHEGPRSGQQRPETVAVGVEEEFHIVDRQTRRLTAPTDRFVKSLPDDRFGSELQRSVVEANSRPWIRLADLAEDIAALRQTVIAAADLSTAQNALSAIQSSAQTTLNDLATWTPSANSGASLQNMGQSALQSLIASTNATSGDQYVFGGINSAVAPMADYYSTPTSAAKTAIDQAFQTTFGVLPSDPGRGEHLGVGHAELSFRAVRRAVYGRVALRSADWSSASSANTSESWCATLDRAPAAVTDASAGMLVLPGKVSSVKVSKATPPGSTPAEACSSQPSLRVASLPATRPSNPIERVPPGAPGTNPRAGSWKRSPRPEE